jgi:hypothetical protein
VAFFARMPLLLTPDDDTLVLEFLQTNMVPGMVSGKERDRVL